MGTNECLADVGHEELHDTLLDIKRLEEARKPGLEYSTQVVLVEYSYEGSVCPLRVAIPISDWDRTPRGDRKGNGTKRTSGSK